MEIALAVLLVLSFPIIAIAGLVIAIGARDRVRILETTFCRLSEGRAPLLPPLLLRRTQQHAPATPRRCISAAAQPSRRVPAAPPPAAIPDRTPILRPGRQPPLPCRPHRLRRRPGRAGPMGFEERLGTQWTVWVGGVALALGGFFLVRYSIEQGWFGPGMRVFLGALLALALIAAGEWARRKENLTGIGGLPAAHIPSILTAAGTAVAYADIYAAFAAL